MLDYDKKLKMTIDLYCDIYKILLQAITEGVAYYNRTMLAFSSAGTS